MWHLPTQTPTQPKTVPPAGRTVGRSAPPHRWPPAVHRAAAGGDQSHLGNLLPRMSLCRVVSRDTGFALIRPLAAGSQNARARRDSSLPRRTANSANLRNYLPAGERACSPAAPDRPRRRDRRRGRGKIPAHAPAALDRACLFRIASSSSPRAHGAIQDAGVVAAGIPGALRADDFGDSRISVEVDPHHARSTLALLLQLALATPPLPRLAILGGDNW